MIARGAAVGTAWARRVPAGAKLVALALFAGLVTTLAATPLPACASFVVAAGIWLCAGCGPGGLARMLWRLRWVVLLLAGTSLVFVSAPAALATTARVVAVLLFAEAVMRTTAATTMLAAVERWLAPLRAVGVDPARVALTLQLTLSAVPVVAAHAQRVREAQDARGIRLGWRAVLPMLVLALRHADDVGDALRARGIA